MVFVTSNLFLWSNMLVSVFSPPTSATDFWVSKACPIYKDITGPLFITLDWIAIIGKFKLTWIHKHALFPFWKLKTAKLVSIATLIALLSLWRLITIFTAFKYFMNPTTLYCSDTCYKNNHCTGKGYPMKDEAKQTQFRPIYVTLPNHCKTLLCRAVISSHMRKPYIAVPVEFWKMCVFVKKKSK